MMTLSFAHAWCLNKEIVNMVFSQNVQQYFVAGLAVAFGSIAATNIITVQTDKKMERIIIMLDEIKEEQQARSSITCLIDMGLNVLEHFSKQKEKE